MKSGETYWDLVKPIWEAVSIYDGGDTFLKQFGAISDKQQVLFSSHWAQSEICNGGFHQFFWNSTGVLAPEAVVAFRTLGMTTCAKTITEAMRFFGKAFPRARNVRCDALEEYGERNPDAWNPLRSLDDKFFDAIDSERDGYDQAATRYAFANGK